MPRLVNYLTVFSMLGCGIFNRFIGDTISKICAFDISPFQNCYTVCIFLNPAMQNMFVRSN